MKTELDYMEYASDAAAQAAYVTNASVSGTYASQYPPVQSGTYVKATSQLSGTDYNPEKATDPAKSLTGAIENNSWTSASGGQANQRFHIDLGSAKVINRIYYENGHDSGVSTDRAPKNFTFWGSNSAISFADLTYATDTGWIQLTTDISALVQHVAADQADPKYVVVTNTTAYRYYAFKFADNWGSAILMGIRRVELQSLPTIDLYAYSEATIKTQGAYSIKGIAATTSALNKTLTKTF